ncbi:hypothetical protein ACLOJK_037568 [Asimina triloba]
MEARRWVSAYWTGWAVDGFSSARVSAMVVFLNVDEGKNPSLSRTRLSIHLAWYRWFSPSPSVGFCRSEIYHGQTWDGYEDRVADFAAHSAMLARRCCHGGVSSTECLIDGCSAHRIL